MKSKPPEEWTESEARRLSTLARRKVSAEDIAKALGRHAASIRQKARSLGLLLFKKLSPDSNNHRSDEAMSHRLLNLLASRWTNGHPGHLRRCLGSTIHETIGFG
jgi:hypothetical protein